MTGDLKEILVRNGVSPSYHRLKIFEYLVQNRTHPTAESIHAELIRNIPTLSKTTVYNTLKTLAEKRLITAVTVEENEVRYDAETRFHCHFKCSSCDGLYDIEPAQAHSVRIPASGRKIQGHLVLETHLYFKGTCKKCLKNH